MGLYSKNKQSTRKYRWDLHDRITVGATQQPSAELNDSLEVLLIATVDCLITVSPESSTTLDAATNAIPLAANTYFHLEHNVGDHVIVRRQTADGLLYILPVDGQDPH